MKSTRVPTIRSPRRALVVTLRFLGDALLSTALLHALKQRWPECAIDVLTFSGTEGAFEGNADVARVMAVPERASAGETMRQTLALWRRYDLAVVAQTGTRPFLFGWAAGRQRVGLVSAEPGKSWWKRALLDAYAVFDDRGARVLENQRIARLLGIGGAPMVVPPSAGWGDSEVAGALGFDPAVTPFAIVHPSPRWRYKQWTRDGWHGLVRDLAARGLRVVITGGPAPEERAYLDALLDGLDCTLYDRFDARWSLAQTADVLRRAVLYVGPDTATTHLAAACGTDRRTLWSHRSVDLGSVAGTRGRCVCTRCHASESRQCGVAAEPGTDVRAVPARRLRAASRQLFTVPRPPAGEARHRGGGIPAQIAQHYISTMSYCSWW